MKTNAIAKYYQRLRSTTTDPARLAKINEEETENQRAYQSYIGETIKAGETPIRFAVYNSSGKFMGYKADSFWTLHEAFAKIHPQKDIGRLLRNFPFCRNQTTPKKKINKETLEVCAEELDPKGEPVKVLEKYQVSYLDGKYEVKKTE